MRYTQAVTFALLLAVLPQIAAAEPQVITSAGQHGALVELYTSEGCSSCPPSDRWLSDLKDDPRLWKQIVPIALHVDYWDYIGWKDPFASPENTLRQKLHARENNMRTIYTPGFFVDGQEWRRWGGLRSLPLDENAATGSLQLTIDGTHIRAEFSNPAITDGLKLTVAILGMDISEAVKRGENAGKRLEHDFVALAMQTANLEPNGSGASANMNFTTQLRQPASRYAIAAWVSERGSQKPLQAVGAYLADAWPQ